MKTAVKERPILFTPAMAQAIYEGRKTQTRRVVKIKKHPDHTMLTSPQWAEPGETIWLDPANPTGAACSRFCPYGVPGDRLFVREQLHLECDGVWYYGDGEPVDIPAEHETAMRDRFRVKRRSVIPNIHMPSWACRSVLEVVSVRVESVDGIRTEDAVAEGFDNCTHFLNTFYRINKRAPEGSNPWVWVVEFRRIDQ